MELSELLIILILSILISAILYFGFGRHGPYRAYWTFLLLLFLSGVAGRLWIIPAGPELGGYAWMPLLFWISLIAILLAAASPAKDADEQNEGMEDSSIDPARAEIDRRVAQQEITPEGAVAALGVFFWIFLFLLLLAILTGSIL